MSTNCLPFIQIEYEQNTINIDDRGKKLPCLAGKLKHYKTGQLLTSLHLYILTSAIGGINIRYVWYVEVILVVRLLILFNLST